MFTIFLQSSLSAVERFHCGANIDGNVYDFSALSATYPVIVKDNPSGTYTYYYAVCRSLTSAEVGTNEDVSGYSLVRKYTNGSIEKLLYTDMFDYRLVDKNDPSLGFIYVGEGEPFYSHDAQLQMTMDVSHYFRCDSTVQGQNFPTIVDIDDDQQDGVITLTSVTNYGCKVRDDTPPTDPQVIPYDSDFVYRDANHQDFGMQFDLKDYNGGWRGVKTLVEINNNRYFLHYQPAGRLACPAADKAACDSEESSCWLCTEDYSDCDTFGLAQEQIITKLVNPTVVGDGVKIILKTQAPNTRSMELKVTANLLYPSGHFVIEPKAELDGNVLRVDSVSKLAAIKKIEDLSPITDCYIHSEKNGSAIDVDLEKLDVDNGWLSQIQATIGTQIRSFDLIYQPCGRLKCPSPDVCDGDDGATVWLCTGNNGSYTKCDGYGLYENGIKVAISDLRNGITATYSGDLKRSAKVQYVCSDTLQPGTIVMPTIGKLEDKELSFSILSKDICPSNPPTNTPVPPFEPTIPTPGPTPQLPIPPSTFLSANETHYIQVNAQKLPSIEESNVYLLNGHEQLIVKNIYAPWNPVKYDESYVDVFDHKTANSWTCYEETTGRRACYPTGDKNYGMEIRDTINGDLERGLTFMYDSYDMMKTEYLIRCDKDMASYNDLAFDDLAEYNELGPIFSYHLKSKFACAEEFQEFLPPEHPGPTPSPDPSYQPQTRIAKQFGEYAIDFDLSQIKTIDQRMIGFRDFTAERFTILFSPMELINGFQYMRCLPLLTKSNIWKCYPHQGSGGECYAFGDKRYGLSMEFIYDDGLDTANNGDYNLGEPRGVSVTYQGGMNLVSTRMDILCNMSMKRNDINFFDTQQKSETQLYIRGESYEVCKQMKILPTDSQTQPTQPTKQPTTEIPPSPHTDTQTSGGSGTTTTTEQTTSSEVVVKKVSGGSVFLVVVMIGVLLYIGGGVVFNFIRTGAVSIPNQAFWFEVGDSIKTGFIFIFTCGKRTSIQYDAV